MMNEYNTIEYKEKNQWKCQNKIDELLSLLPAYCTDFERWMKQKCVIKTRMEYLQDVYTFMRFLYSKNPSIQSIADIELQTLEKLNGFDFDEYNEWLGSYKFNQDDPNEKVKTNSAVTKKRKLSSLRTFFHFLYIREMISCNPSEKAIMPLVKKKKRKDIRTLEDDECAVFLKYIDDCYKTALKNVDPDKDKRSVLRPAIVLRDKAIIYLFLGTGLRVSELCAINCENISFQLNYINVIRKEDSDDSGTTDKVYPSEEVMEVLLSYLHEARDVLSPNTDNYDALFISSKHERITPRAVEMMVKGYAEKVLGKNCGITPHKLRATFGTRFYAMTKDISATSTAMNHSGIEITATHYIKEDQRAKELAAKLKIK